MSSEKEKPDKQQPKHVNPLGKHHSTRDQRTLAAPHWMHKYVIGKKGVNLVKLKGSFPNVSVHCHEHENKITVTGPSEHVAIVSQRIDSMYISAYADCAVLKIEPYFMGAIIGKGGEHIKQLQKDTNANVTVDSKTNSVRIEGRKADVLDAKQRIESKVEASERMILKNLSKQGFFHPDYRMLTIECTPEELTDVCTHLPNYKQRFPRLKIELDRKKNIIDIRGKKNDALEVEKDILKYYVTKEL